MLTMLVVFSLLIAGPASAVTLRINGLENIDEDETDSFVVSVDMAEGENIPLDNITLTIGTESCTFALDGTELGGDLCTNVNAVSLAKVGYNPSASNQWGYGYGYAAGYGYGFYNHTYTTGYGYGYLAGYGYAASPYGEVALTVTFEPWDITSDTTYDVSVSASADGKSYKTQSDSQITVSAVATTGGGTTSNDDSSTTFAPDSNTYEKVDDTVEEEIAGDLGIPADQVRDIYTKKVISELTAEDIELALADAPEEAKATMQEMVDKIASGSFEEASITKELENIKVYKTDGTVARYSKVTLSVEGLDGVVTIVEIIPKDVAESASDLIYSIAPEVLLDDPILKWEVDTATTSEISYTVKKELSSIGSTTYAIDEKVATTTDDTTGDNTGGDDMMDKPDTTKTTDPDTNKVDIPEAGSMWGVIGIILAILIVIALIVFVVKRAKE
jgi:hypothetical protein